jgi:DNA-binding protein YbaB
MSTDLRRFAQLVQGAQKLVDAAAAITNAVERRLSGTQSVGMSDARMVKVITDHRARVTRIEIAPAGLTRTRGPELAQQVVQAVTRAQAQARAEYERVLRTGH